MKIHFSLYFFYYYYCMYIVCLYVVYAMCFLMYSNVFLYKLVFSSIIWV